MDRDDHGQAGRGQLLDVRAVEQVPVEEIAPKSRIAVITAATRSCAAGDRSGKRRAFPGAGETQPAWDVPGSPVASGSRSY